MLSDVYNVNSDEVVSDKDENPAYANCLVAHGEKQSLFIVEAQGDLAAKDQSIYLHQRPRSARMRQILHGGWFRLLTIDKLDVAFVPMRLY